ncbi:hypothetical protein GCM10020331_103340 [Ectobacillus funiculus]
MWLSSLILGSLALSWTVSLDIAVLSVEEVERSTFPLLSTIRNVNLMEFFLQRLDVIVVYTLLITVFFFKAAIYLYGALMGMVDLFKLKKSSTDSFTNWCYSYINSSIF